MDLQSIYICIDLNLFADSAIHFIMMSIDVDSLDAIIQIHLSTLAELRGWLFFILISNWYHILCPFNYW